MPKPIIALLADESELVISRGQRDNEDGTVTTYLHADVDITNRNDNTVVALAHVLLLARSMMDEKIIKAKERRTTGLSSSHFAQSNCGLMERSFENGTPVEEIKTPEGHSILRLNIDIPAEIESESFASAYLEALPRAMTTTVEHHPDTHARALIPDAYMDALKRTQFTIRQESEDKKLVLRISGADGARLDPLVSALMKRMIRPDRHKAYDDHIDVYEQDIHRLKRMLERLDIQVQNTALLQAYGDTAAGHSRRSR